MSRRPRPRYRGICAICWVDPQTGRMGTNATTQICPKCSADPANRDADGNPLWIETWEDVDEFVAERANGTRLAELTDKKLRPPSELKQQILDLATRGAYEEKQYYRADGRKTGRKKAYVKLSFREIARRVGCSEWHVRNVIRKQLA